MQDLNFEVQQIAGQINCNFTELKEALALQMSAYADCVVTDDTISNYKGELATLRKIRKAVDDKRKEIKNEYNKPLEEFEKQVKTLLEEIDKPIENISTQLFLFEEDRIMHKRERIAKLYAEQVGEYIDYLPLEANYNPKWDNKSYSNEDIKFDISEKLLKVKNDLNVISSLKSEIEPEVLEIYKNTGDLSKAITRNQQYLSDKQKIEIQSKAETKEIPAETKANPLEGTILNDFVEMTKTAKIIVSLEDLKQVKETLDFMGIKYQVEGE